MAFYTSNLDQGDYGEYYNSYSTSYDTVPFQNSPPSSYYYTSNSYEIVPFDQEYSSPSSIYVTNDYEIVPLQDSLSNYVSSGYDNVQFHNSPTTSYDIVPFQYSSSSSNYTTSCYDIVPYQDSYVHLSYNTYPDPILTPTEVNYYAQSVSEPKYLEYNPNLNDTHYFFSDTRFLVSYSKAPTIDDTDYDEYDPTPYDGGYDITQTYGKSLPPSEKTCYPRSNPETNSLSPDNFSYALVPSPYGNSEKNENKTEKVPTMKGPLKSCLKKQKPNVGNGDDNNVKELEKKPLKLSKLGEESKGGNCDNKENYGDYYCNYGKSVVQGPYGYGLEAVDLCESLFGYWPCLDKRKRIECRCVQVGDAADDDDDYIHNQWKSAADYLFASPYTYAGN